MYIYIYIYNKLYTIYKIYNILFYYCNKLTEDLFCLAEQRNNCLSKKVVFISIINCIYRLICINF